jgi:hypothetical protein
VFQEEGEEGLSNEAACLRVVADLSRNVGLNCQRTNRPSDEKGNNQDGQRICPVAHHVFTLPIT